MCTELTALCMKMWDMHLAKGCTKKRLLPHTVNATCVCWYGCWSCHGAPVRELKVSIAPLPPALSETFIINRNRIRNAEEMVKRKSPMTLKTLNHPRLWVCRSVGHCRLAPNLQGGLQKLITPALSFPEGFFSLRKRAMRASAGQRLSVSSFSPCSEPPLGLARVPRLLHF